MAEFPFPAAIHKVVSCPTCRLFYVETSPGMWTCPQMHTKLISEYLLKEWLQAVLNKNRGIIATPERILSSIPREGRNDECPLFKSS